MTKDGLVFTKTLEAGSDTALIRTLVYDRNSGRRGTVMLPIR